MKQSKTGKILGILSTVLVLTGVFGMCQPLVMPLYTHGFVILLAGVALQNIAAHI